MYIAELPVWMCHLNKIAISSPSMWNFAQSFFCFPLNGKMSSAFYLIWGLPLTPEWFQLILCLARWKCRNCFQLLLLPGLSSQMQRMRCLLRWCHSAAAYLMPGKLTCPGSAIAIQSQCEGFFFFKGDVWAHSFLALFHILLMSWQTFKLKQSSLI